MPRFVSLGIILFTSVVGACGDGSTGDIRADPIVERTPTGAMRCQPDVEITNQSPTYWTGFGWNHGLSTRRDGALRAVRVESRRDDPFGPPGPSQLVVAAVDATGTSSVASVLEPDASEVTQLTTTTAGSGIAAVWTDGPGLKRLRFALVGGDDQVAARADLLTSDVAMTQLEIAHHADRSAVLFATDDNGYARIRLTIVDDSGAEVLAPTLVAESTEQYARLPAGVIATSDGFALSWIDASEMGSAVRFQRLDSNGAALGEESVLSDPLDETEDLGGAWGFAGFRMSMLALDDGFVVAWVRSSFNDDYTDAAGWSVIELARLDASGVRIGPVVPLQRPENDLDAQEPELIWLGEHLALTWSEGEKIYLCGGCVPDHDAKLVLLDPSTLNPISEVSVLKRPEGGGLLFRRSAALDDRIVLTTRIVYHVTSDAAVGVFQCTPTQ